MTWRYMLLGETKETFEVERLADEAVRALAEADSFDFEDRQIAVKSATRNGYEILVDVSYGKVDMRFVGTVVPAGDGSVVSGRISQAPIGFLVWYGITTILFGYFLFQGAISPTVAAISGVFVFLLVPRLIGGAPRSSFRRFLRSAALAAV